MEPDFIPPQIEVRELSTIDQAVALLDEWMSAYEDLRRAYTRLEVRCFKAETRAETDAFLLRSLDPFLPDSMQNAKARQDDPGIYKALAELRHPIPEPEPELAEENPFA